MEAAEEEAAAAATEERLSVRVSALLELRAALTESAAALAAASAASSDAPAAVPAAAPSLSARFCSGCGRLPAAGAGVFKLCSGCRTASYCSAACQRSQWPAHRPACKASQDAARAAQGALDKAARAAIGEASARRKGRELLSAVRRSNDSSVSKEERQRRSVAALRLIGEGADVDYREGNGWTALINATGDERLDAVVARLVAAGAQLNFVDPRMSAPALSWACLHKNAATAMLLVEAGAATNLTARDCSTALDHAIANGLASVAAALRAVGGRTGAEGREARSLGALDRAARAKLSKTAAAEAGEQLLEACLRAARVGATEEDKAEGAAAALQALGAGADVNFADTATGLTPLMLACCCESDGVVLRLIAAGAKLDPVDKSGWPALTFACFRARAAAATLLVEAGSPLNHVGSDCRTALDLARLEGLASVAAAIRARGGLTGAEVASRASRE